MTNEQEETMSLNNERVELIEFFIAEKEKHFNSLLKQIKDIFALNKHTDFGTCSIGNPGSEYCSICKAAESMVEDHHTKFKSSSNLMLYGKFKLGLFELLSKSSDELAVIKQHYISTGNIKYDF